MPEFSEPTPFWLDVAAILALGAVLLLPFAWALRYADRPAPATRPIWTADHG
jgi:hypothetical protein